MCNMVTLSNGFDEVRVVHAYWSARLATGEMSMHSRSRYIRVLDSFARYIVTRGGCRVATVSQAICRDFVFAPQSNGLAPAAATSRFRLTVVRDSYVAWIKAGLTDHDPTAGLSVRQPPQTRSPTPLTPVEFARLRASGRTSPRDQVRPVAVELANAGGSHEEIALVVVSDVDLSGSRVRFDDRWSALDAFAATTLSARIANCRLAARRRRADWDPATTAVAMARPLATYPATSIAPGISSSLSRAMRSAGLTRPALRPASIREYAANRAYAQTGRIECVAELLGLSSLDTAMRFIDHRWQDAHGDQVRAD